MLGKLLIMEQPMLPPTRNVAAVIALVKKCVERQNMVGKENNLNNLLLM